MKVHLLISLRTTGLGWEAQTQERCHGVYKNRANAVFASRVLQRKMIDVRRERIREELAPLSQDGLRAKLKDVRRNGWFQCEIDYGYAFHIHIVEVHVHSVESFRFALRIVKERL